MAKPQKPKVKKNAVLRWMTSSSPNSSSSSSLSSAPAPAAAAAAPAPAPGAAAVSAGASNANAENSWERLAGESPAPAGASVRRSASESASKSASKSASESALKSASKSNSIRTLQKMPIGNLYDNLTTLNRKRVFVSRITSKAQDITRNIDFKTLGDLLYESLTSPKEDIKVETSIKDMVRGHIKPIDLEYYNTAVSLALSLAGKGSAQYDDLMEAELQFLVAEKIFIEDNVIHLTGIVHINVRNPNPVEVKKFLKIEDVKTLMMRRKVVMRRIVEIVTKIDEYEHIVIPKNVYVSNERNWTKEEYNTLKAEALAGKAVALLRYMGMVGKVRTRKNGSKRRNVDQTNSAENRGEARRLQNELAVQRYQEQFIKGKRRENQFNQHRKTLHHLKGQQGNAPQTMRQGHQTHRRTQRHEQEQKQTVANAQYLRGVAKKAKILANQKARIQQIAELTAQYATATTRGKGVIEAQLKALRAPVPQPQVALQGPVAAQTPQPTTLKGRQGLALAATPQSQTQLQKVLQTA